MKNVFLCRLVLLVCLSFACAVSQAKGKDNDSRQAAGRVLMLGLTDNVKSNYFPKVTIAEETGITDDLIDREYNRIIMDNIIASAKPACKFIPLSDAEWMGLIRVSGEGDECYSDVSQVPDDDYRRALTTAEAQYLLVLNQHYLKWQETPMRTLFHIVSYTLFDQNKHEVCRGHAYFTSMKLERPDKLRKISSKTSSRIASAITNQFKSL
jgi:hypothetical protein